MAFSVARAAGRHGPALLSCLLALGQGLAQTPPSDPVPASGPYPLLDQVRGAHTRLATFPIRPMVESPDGSGLWVVNQTLSTLEHFAYPSTTPVAFPVPWDPVAVAYWQGTAPGADDDELLVVCRGSWAVAVLDPSGRLKTTIQLRAGDPVHPAAAARMGMMAEPGDVVVDQVNHRAFVSCSGADSVLQIDLTTHQVARVFSHRVAGDDFRLKHPLFLWLDPATGEVYVAPMHAGNRSMAERDLTGGEVILDVPLPDQDLFRITPFLSTANPGSVTPVSTGNGAILFMHGRNGGPGGDYWQLGTDALNKVHISEPAAKGKFVVNQAMRITNPFGPGETKTPIPLDPVGYPSGGFLQNGEQIGQPFALSFHPNGKVFVIGLLTPRVVVLNGDGTFYKEWDLPAGHRLPRGVLAGVNPTVVHVYCYDSNAVLTYRWNTAGPGLLGTRTLTHDPTPAVAKAGRLVFFDGSNSQFGNLSCASCHVDGGSDQLAWNLSNAPLEQKGPMITQTLVGLERLPPFHWRGERQLIDFRGAFQGLLGKATELPLAQFEEMEAFVFSLRNPSNPNQNRDRVLDATIHVPDPMASIEPVGHTVVTGNAVLGAGNFAQNTLPNEPPIFAGREFTCANCHRVPTGTGNDINPEQQSAFLPRRISMKPTPFHELWRKQQPLVPITIGTFTVAAPLIGTGFSHMGQFTDLFRFVDVVVKFGTTPIDFNAVTANVADFIHQWDQGIAPAAQFAFHLDLASAGLAAQELDGYLTTHRAAGNCDVGVFGQVQSGSSLVTRRWYFSRRLARFVCEDPGIANRTLADFENPANLAAGEANTFLGLPMGLAERLIDHDLDSVLNLDPLETAPFDPAVPGFPDASAPQFGTQGSPTIRWASTRVARLTFETTEPTTAEVRYWDQAQGLVSERKVFATSLSRAHALILPGLRGGTPRPSHELPPFQFDPEDVTYNYEVTLRDRANNATVSSILTFEPADFIELAGFSWQSQHDADAAEHREHFVQSLCLGGPNCDNVTNLGNNQWRVQVTATVAFKRGRWVVPSGGTALSNPRAPSRALAGRVFVRRAPDAQGNTVVLTAAQAGLTLTPATDCVQVSKVFSSPMAGFAGERELGLNGFTGPFLVTTAATLADGIATLTFDVDGNSGQQLFAGDRIVFVVDGIVDVDPAAVPAAIDLTSVPGEARLRSPRARVAWSTWSFPDTKEAGGAVETRGL